MIYLRLQLKVCGGCGGLWFRTQGRADIYCFACEGKYCSAKRQPIAKRLSGWQPNGAEPWGWPQRR